MKMKTHQMHACVYVLVIVSGAFADKWVYPPESPNGVITTEEEWGGMCETGRRQSPIDLSVDASIVGHYSSLMVSNYAQMMKNATVVNTGHAVQINIDTAQQKYSMSGAGLKGLYNMVQMHFHWSSEHTLDRKRYALELHMVSFESRFANLAEAMKVKNGVAVLGILFYAGDAHNANVKNILDSFEPVRETLGKTHPLKEPLSPEQLLPKNRNRYYRYEGSLTTPGCAESVMWTILTEPVPVTLSQIERFKMTMDDSGHQLTHNYRPLKPLNSRALIYVEGPPGSGAPSSMYVVSALLLAAGQAAAFYAHKLV